MSFCDVAFNPFLPPCVTIAVYLGARDCFARLMVSREGCCFETERFVSFPFPGNYLGVEEPKMGKPSSFMSRLFCVTIYNLPYSSQPLGTKGSSF